MNRQKIISQITSTQYETLIKNGSLENRDNDHAPVIKLFLPGTGFTWLINEISPIETNLAFGLCDVAMGFPEMGYIDLDELADISTIFKVERDIHFQGIYPLSVYAEAARSIQGITEDELLLAQAAKKLNKFRLD